MQKASSYKPSSSTTYRYRTCNKEHLLPEFVQHYQEIKVFKHDLFQTLTEKLSQEKIKNLKSIYLHGIAARDNTGNLVVVDKIGGIKISEVNKIMDEETFINYTISRLYHISEQVLQQKQTVVWIFDLTGKIMQLASKKVINILKKILEVSIKYFPGMVSKIIFFGTPMLFDTIWSQLQSTVPQ